MGKKGAKRKTRWRTLSIGTPPGEEDEEDGTQRNGYVKSEHRSPIHYSAGGKDASQRNGYHQQQQQQQQQQHHHHHHHHHQQQQQPWLKSRHGSAGSSSNGGSSSGYASGESRIATAASFNEDEYTKITTPRQDMLFKKGYLSQRKQQLFAAASTSATPSTAESQSASHSTADGSEAAEDQQLLDSGAPTDYLATATALEAGPATQLSYGTYYDHASGYYYEYPMMLVGPALPAEQMHHVPCAAVPCAPVPLRPIEWVNPAFVPKLASQQYCYMDYQTQGPDCGALVDAQGMPLTAEPLTNGLSNETSLTGSASVSASGSVAGDVDESNAALAMVDQEMTDQQQQPAAVAAAVEVIPLDVVDQAEVVALPMEFAPVEAPPYVEPQAMPYLYPGQYMFGPPVVNVNGVTIQSGPMLRCSDMVASSAAAAAAAAAAKRRKKKKKKKQKRPHALGNAEDEDEEDYSSEGDTTVSSLSRVPWPAAAATSGSTASAATTTTTTATTTSRPLNPECQEFHLPESLNASTEASSEPRLQPCNEVNTRLTENEEQLLENCEESANKPKTRRRSLKIVREATPGPELRDELATDDRREDEEDNDTAENEQELHERPIEQVTAMLADASIIEATPRKDGDVDASGWQNESSITSESCCAASRTADETEDSGFESQATTAATAATAAAAAGKSRPITDAVNEWLKRANSPDLFITSSASSESEEDEEEDADEHQSKNLQGNPMPALSVNGQVASHEQFASAACKHRSKKRTQRRKRDRSEQSGKRDLAQETAEFCVLATGSAAAGALSLTTGDELSVTNKDSDAGVRVAEKPRITNYLENDIARAQQQQQQQQQQSVKTYEKGEIVVSMDGELLLVESVTPLRRGSSSSSSSSSSRSGMEASLGSIEEPDLVLECWEPEIVEPIGAAKTSMENYDEDAASSAEDKAEAVAHVRRYYRLIEEQVQPAKVAPLDCSGGSAAEESSDEDVAEEPLLPLVVPGKCISYDPRLPVDEAFEVYESCYNGKTLPAYRHRSPLHSADPNEAPIPCKANCCNIQ